MTKKQAIEELRFNKVDDTYIISGDALDMAIKALENQKIGHWKIWAETINCFNFTLGDFTETEYHCKCSECGTEIIPEESMQFQFCPICGTKMEGE